MREKIARAPRWVIQVVSAILFTIGMAASGLLQGADPGTAVAGAALGGVLFGTVGGWFFHRSNQQMLAATGGRVPSREVRRATWRGDPPADPAARQQALALVDLQLGHLRWARPSMLVLAGLMGALFVVGVVFLPPPSWIVLVTAMAFVLVGEGSHRLARRRRAVLTASSEDSREQ